MTVTLRSFAKINLGLRIGASRADGYHELLTVYQTIGLHDLVRVSIERGSGIEIHCADARVPKDETNTCYRIAVRAMQLLRAKGRVRIQLDKRLPVQGGLGGASANAVSTLLGLERGPRGAGLSIAGFACDGLRGRYARDWGVYAEGIWGMGSAESRRTALGWRIDGRCPYIDHRMDLR